MTVQLRPVEGVADVLVVGGGLAGAATALRLARAGATVTLLERDAAVGRTKVCGEFLSAGALAQLDALGVDAAAMGALPLETVRLTARGRTATVRLPFRAASLSRAALDAALLDQATHAGASIVHGANVRRLQDSDGWQATTTDGRVFAGRRLVIASGKHDLSGRPHRRGLHDTLVGLKLHAAVDAALATHLGRAVELVFAPELYCGLQPVEGGRVNVCLLVERSRLKAASIAGVLEAIGHASPRAKAVLAAVERPDPVAIAALPYGFVRRSSEGPFHVGDQAAVIPSFAGEGMAIALLSANMAADAILAGADADAMQGALARRVGGRVRRAALLSRLAVRPVTQSLAVTAGRLAPRTVRRAALSTRIAHASD